MKSTISIHEVIDKMNEEYYENAEESPQIEEILDLREETYGSFAMNSIVTQGLKAHIKMGTNWGTMSSAHREALEMICHKMSRIVNGNSDYKDSWTDIQGYANLAEKECR